MGRRGISRLVIASSMVVYGEGAYDCAKRRPGPARAPCIPATWPRAVSSRAACSARSRSATATVTEDAPLDPRNAYAASKVAQEHLTASSARMTGGAAVGLRYHNVYGPRMPRDTPYSGVAAIFRSCLENGVPPRVFEDGGQRRDFVHVRDVARANLLALEAVSAQEVLSGADPGCGRGGRAAVLQRGERRAAHGGRDGQRAGRGVRRRDRAGGDRRVPPRGRPARGGLPRGRRRETSVSGPRSGSPRAWPSSPAPPSASPRRLPPPACRPIRSGRGSTCTLRRAAWPVLGPCFRVNDLRGSRGRPRVRAG